MPERYKHFKGGIYQLICRGRLEADRNAKMVVYKAEDETIWIRPESEFFGFVQVDGHWLSRFTKIEEVENQ
jgi:hypothetical protein